MRAENAPLMKYILWDLGLLDMLLFEQKVSLSEPNFVLQIQIAFYLTP